MRAGKELREILKSDRERDTQPDRAPQRVAAADPVPEFEHVVRIDSERLDRLAVRRERDEMLRDRLDVAELLEEPALRRFRVRHGLLRRKRLRSDDKERRFRIQLLERLDDVRSVDVRNEVRRDIRLVGRERLANHARPEVGAADPDIDDVRNRLARKPAPFARTDAVAKTLHLIENAIDVRHDVLAVDVNRRVAAVPERDVQNGAAFRHVDLLAGKHHFGLLFDLRLFRERDEKIDRLFRNAVLGVIEKDPAEFNGKLAESVRIGREHLAHRRRL